jgi:hypothetical protein
MAVVDIQRVFRALADVRDTDFYLLWVDLTRSWPEPLPRIMFRIYRIADTADEAMVVVGVEGTRGDGIGFVWSVSVTARSDHLVIEGSIETGSSAGVISEVFRRSDETQDPGRAAELVRVLAGEVCGQRW